MFDVRSGGLKGALDELNQGVELLWAERAAADVELYAISARHPKPALKLGVGEALGGDERLMRGLVKGLVKGLGVVGLGAVCVLLMNLKRGGR